jgi:hypothetical protein
VLEPNKPSCAKSANCIARRPDMQTCPDFVSA